MLEYNKTFFFPGEKKQNYRAACIGNRSVLGLVSRRKCLLLPLGPCEPLNFKHLTNIKQAKKQAMSGNYLRVTMFGVLFSVAKKCVNVRKSAAGVFQ